MTCRRQEGDEQASPGGKQALPADGRKGNTGMRHLIHIGYPKAGSTFLQRCFEQHPQLLYRNFAMGGFYNLSTLPDTVLRRREKPIAYVVTSQEAISIGKSTILPEGDDFAHRKQKQGRTDIHPREYSAFLSEYFPGATILVITRGFASRAISTYKESIRAGITISLHESLALQVRLKHTFSDYDGLIRTYREAFGDDHVIVLPYELLRDDSDRFLAILQERLGLTEPFTNPGITNAARTDQELHWLRMAGRLLQAGTKWMGTGLYVSCYRKHIEYMRRDRYRPVLFLLRHLFPHKKLDIGKIPAGFLAEHRSLATCLQALPEYRPYRAEYLLDRAPEVADAGPEARPPRPTTPNQPHQP